MVSIGAEQFVCELSAVATASAEVEPGAMLKVRCRHACDRELGPGPVRATAANPATGPIAVAGARPGQALRLEILDIAPEPVGHVSAGWGGGNRAVPIQNGEALFDGIRIPLAPMIGVLGVAPAEGSWSTMACGPFGGNMDTNDIAPGATVFLPVFRPGGLFVLGDVHAVIGDGEIGGQGLEVAAEVTLRVGIEPQPLLSSIYLCRNDEVITVGTGEWLDQACTRAERAMMALIERAGTMDEFDAMKFLGLAGQVRVGQHCCPTKSARVAVPLRYLPELRSRLSGSQERL